MSLWQWWSDEVESKNGNSSFNEFLMHKREKPIGVCQQRGRQEVTDGMKGELRSHEEPRQQYFSKKDK